MSKIQVLSVGQKEWSTIHDVTGLPTSDGKALVFSTRTGRGAIMLKRIVAWVYI